MKYVNHVRKVAIEEIERQENLDHKDSRRLVLNRFESAVIVPAGEHGGGLYSTKGLVDWSNFNGREEPTYDGPSEYCDEEVLYIGMMFGVWGHCLTDFLRHVWPLLKHKFKVAYTTVLPTNKMPDNYFRMLNALGVPNEDIIRITRPTKFRSVLFGDPSNYRDEGRNGRFFTQEYVDTIEKIRAYYLAEKECPEHVEAVYLSRSGWKKGQVDFGEHLVETAFMRYYNCKVVHPESLSLGAMIRLLSSCDTLVTTEGSIAHNSVFMREGTNLISIRKTDYVNWYQPMISQSRQLNVTYIDANYTYLLPPGNAPWFGPFLMGVNRKLADYLGCPTSKFQLIKPFFGFFCRYVISRSRRCLSCCKTLLIRLLKSV